MQKTRDNTESSRPSCDWITPDWPAPDSVFALSTTRRGGVSSRPYDSMNLGDHVEDEGEAVFENRALLRSAVPGDSRIQWLNQVHGTEVAKADQADTALCADAVWSDSPGLFCAVLTADCLPILLCNIAGDCVAAVHAGWRGLAAGVVEATLAAMPARSEDLFAWLGPCIGPRVFEVGENVREAFLDSANQPEGVAHGQALESAFRPHPTERGKYFADLQALARVRLLNGGVEAIYQERACTYSEPERFFSYRRDGRTGRMASVIGLDPLR